MESDLSDLCQQAIKDLSPFPTAYLCETGFMLLQPGDIRRVLMPTALYFDRIVKQSQRRGSH